MGEERQGRRPLELAATTVATSVNNLIPAGTEYCPTRTEPKDYGYEQQGRRRLRAIDMLLFQSP